jgi:addiction module RelE/StbE family toxin
MKLIIRESAYADLERIYAWIARDSPVNAQSVVRRIDSAIEDKLTFFPFMGRRGKTPGTREWLVHGLPYVIVYKVDEAADELTVLAIFHGAQDR